MEYGHHASVSPDGLRIAYSTCEFRTDSLASKFVYYEGDHNLYHYEIATVGMDGESPVRLTENEHYDHYPEWSPDGTRIAFIANSRERLSQTDRWRLFTMSPDGSNVFQVSDKRADLYPPAWSPDGRRIAFAVKEPSAPYERVVYTVRPDGSELTRVLRVEGKPAFLPSWSPDSEELAFASVDGWTVTIYAVNPYGGGLREVWSTEYYNYPSYLSNRHEVSQVSWSPDGAEILVIVNGVIWVGHPDGSGWRRLDQGAFEFMPVDAAAWSSDGSRIAAHGIHQSQKGDGLRVISMARDLADVRVLVGAEAIPNSGTGLLDPPEVERLYAWNAPVREEDVDLTVCSAGVVVPEPEQNPGLVEDCRILLGLRDELAGRGRLGWDADTPIAVWQGIVLGGAPLRVHEVNLSWDDLTGRLPPALGNLTELRRLSLRGNKLTGEIPRELGRLTQLEILSLSSTYLSGPIPPELGGLGKLSALDLSHTNLSGPIPPELGAIEWLQLDLSYTNVSGPIPPELGGLTLIALNLSSTKVSGPIPPEIGASESLYVLNLSYTDVSGPIPPELGGLGSLHKLYLNSTNVSGPIPLELGGLGSLEVLDLSHTNVSGTIPPEFGGLGSLETLNLSYTDLSGPIPQGIGALGNLQALNLEETGLRG